MMKNKKINSKFMTEHTQFMRAALGEAKKACELDEIPIGAVVILNNEIIGRGYNSVIKNSDPTCHAEIMALRDAAKSLSNYRLPEVNLYVTLEPCIMCLGAIFHARVNQVYFGAYDAKFQSCNPQNKLIDNKLINHQTHAIGGILEQECSSILKKFFEKKRSSN
jgi:tRNA(adenine34) deaminase